MSGKWDPCVSHQGPAVTTFISEYFADPSRFVMLIAGAGFDPRAPVISTLIAQAAGSRTRGIFIREERPTPNPALVLRAEQNLQRMAATLPNCEIVNIQIFAQDGAVIGGRGVAQFINGVDLTRITDIIVDCSALSIGISFPMVRQLLSRAETRLNVHLMVTNAPTIDAAIIATASDTGGPVHGFMGELGLSSSEGKAKLWLPQLTKDQKAMLARIYAFRTPDDVCPILPFPSLTPRLADELIEHYSQEFQSSWQVDAGDIVYADEDNPLDLYRTILRMDDTRKRVFAGIGGSIMMISPIGSKALAIGALMAAMERDFPVIYVEAISYVAHLDSLDRKIDHTKSLVHVWLCGDIYPRWDTLTEMTS